MSDSKNDVIDLDVVIDLDDPSLFGGDLLNIIMDQCSR